MIDTTTEDRARASQRWALLVALKEFVREVGSDEVLSAIAAGVPSPVSERLWELLRSASDLIARASGKGE